MREPESNVWRQCSSCKKDLLFGQAYQECSVSTCTRTPIPLSFCSVACWDAHLPSARHREAWAVEARAPSRADGLRAQSVSARTAPTRGPAVAAPTRVPAPAVSTVSIAPPIRAPAAAPARSIAPTAPPLLAAAPTDEILVVVSKLKHYIRERSAMNTSDGVAEALSDHLRGICDEAIRHAAADGRKTVMDRDVKPVTARWRADRSAR